METSNINQIPESERSYWTVGAEDNKPVTQATAPSVWQEYLQLHQQGNWNNALQVINRLAAYDPQQPEVLRAKAKLHGVMGHGACCSYAIHLLLQLAPNDLDALRMQALYQYCHNSHENALTICDTVLDKNPTHADFWALKADILNSRGKHNEAAQACKRALEIKPDCVAALRLHQTIQSTAAAP